MGPRPVSPIATRPGAGRAGARAGRAACRRARARRRAWRPGATSAPTALGTTSPACSESTAGVVSEGLNELDESATAEIRSRRCGPKVIAHGILSGPRRGRRAAPRPRPSRRPADAVQLALRVTGELPPGFSAHPVGLRLELERRRCRCCGRGRAGCASRRCGRRAAARRASRRPPRGRTRATTGSAVISPAALSPRSTSPAPWPVTLSSRIERALPVSRLRGRARAGPGAPGRARRRRRRQRRRRGSSR